MRVINDNLLVKLESQSTTFGNGLSVNNETQNRKDIISGKVFKTSVNEIKEGELVWFPLYAASVVTLSEGEFYIINVDDVMIVDDANTNK
jgi:co-chaperonin GroES (HSP10)